jgi:hypothetical protein
MLPLVHIDLLKNGQHYTGEANVTYLCSLANRTIVNYSTAEPGDMPINCSLGVCETREWFDWYAYNNPCFYSNGRFKVSSENGTITSTEVSLGDGGYYAFGLDVVTGQINASSENPPAIPPENNPLCPILGLFGFVAVLSIAKR